MWSESFLSKHEIFPFQKHLISDIYDENHPTETSIFSQPYKHNVTEWKAVYLKLILPSNFLYSNI